jgi:hypothetical protein
MDFLSGSEISAHGLLLANPLSERRATSGYKFNPFEFYASITEESMAREFPGGVDTVEKVEIWKCPIFLPGGQSSEKPH